MTVALRQCCREENSPGILRGPRGEGSNQRRWIKGEPEAGQIESSRSRDYKRPSWIRDLPQQRTAQSGGKRRERAEERKSIFPTWTSCLAGALIPGSLSGRSWSTPSFSSSPQPRARGTPVPAGTARVARRCPGSSRLPPDRPTCRPHEADRSKLDPGLQPACPSELKVIIKTIGPILWVCVLVRVRGPVR